MWLLSAYLRPLRAHVGIEVLVVMVVLVLAMPSEAALGLLERALILAPVPGPPLLAVLLKQEGANV